MKSEIHSANTKQSLDYDPMSAHFKQQVEEPHAASEEVERLMLSDRDYAQFTASLDNPEFPTLRLRQAAADYGRLTGGRT